MIETENQMKIVQKYIEYLQNNPNYSKERRIERDREVSPSTFG